MGPGESEALSVGTVVNARFQILRIVGQGGLGTVYQVRDTVYGQGNVYALKELIDQSSGARKQFVQEARWLQALDHPNIPKVRQYFEWNGRLYLVMDFVDGENLDQKLRRAGGAGLPELQVLQWILPICDALGYLHRQQPPLLHRDVKPANIIVNAYGHPVLVDLGIAKEHGPGANQTATFVRKAGTEGYAPPEQYTSAGQPGPWSDVYSLGATLYELLSGSISPTAVERIALDTPLVPLGERNPAISSPVSAAVGKALSIRPGDRFQRVVDLAAFLRTAATHGSGAGAFQPSPPLPSTQRPFTPRTFSGPMSSSPPASGVSAPSASGRRLPPPPLAAPTDLPTLTPPLPSNNMYPLDRTPSIQASGMTAPASPGSGVLVGSQPISGAAVGWPEAHAPTAEDARGGRRWYALPIVWVAAIATLLIVVALVGVTLLGLFTPLDRSTPQATVSGYFKALQAQNDARAWQYSALSRNDPTQQSVFVSGLQADVAHYGTVVSFQVEQLTTDALGHVQATVSVVRAKQLSAPLTYTLSVTQYDGSTWLIDSVSGS